MVKIKYAYNLRNLPIAALLAVVMALCALQAVSYCEETTQTLAATNSGLLIISEICDKAGVPITEEEAKELSGLNLGRISFLGVKNALSEKGFTVEGYKVDLNGLKSILGKGIVITAINRKSHFVTVLEVTDSYVKLHDPELGGGSFQYSIDIFKGDWDGKILLVKEPGTILTGASTIEITGEAQLLSGLEMQAEVAAPTCRNTLLDSGLPWWLKLLLTADPVVVANGNLSSEETDFMVQAKGLIPLELKRTYNSQSPSMLNQWIPESGAGPWRIVNGEYCGHGDRSISTYSEGGYTFTARMETIIAGTNEPWMTARINFNYRNANTTYYVLIGTNHKVELGQVYDGLYYVISHDTTLDPYAWNTVKIVTDAYTAKVYFNDQTNPEFDIPLDPRMRTGKIALEACFSHCHFDDVVMTPTGLDPIASDFNTPDREEPFGMGWTFTYGMRLEYAPNSSLCVVMPDDRRPVFKGPPEGGKYKSPKGIYDTLSLDVGGVALTQKDGTKYHFDANRRLDYIQDRFGNRNTLAYEEIDGKERLRRVTDPAGRSLVFDWENGKIKAITAPNGKKYQYFYQNGLLTEVKDPRGNSKFYEYDPIDQVRTKYTDREGNIYEYTYTYNLKVATQKDPDGNYTTFGYYWATTHVTNRDNELWMYTIDPDSLMQKEVKDNLGSATTYYWTPDPENSGKYLPEIEHTVDQYGRKNEYLYDERGNRKWMKDPELNVTELRYTTDYNQVEWKKDACGHETNYIYENGRLARIEEPLGKTTVMEHYDDGKLKKMTGAGNNVTEYEYDANGYTKKIKYYTETGMVEKNFTYDIVGNLQSETDEEGNTTSYVYDENNNLKEVRDGSNNILTSYTYDKNDNIKTITDALGHIAYQEYDWAGNLVKKTEYDEYNVPHTAEYTYDNVDYLHLGKSRLMCVKDQEGNITTYQYSKEWHEGAYGALKTVTDAENRQTKYKYDMVGNMICIEDSAAKKTKYQYNNNDKIWVITYPDSTSEEFHYTPVGDLDNKRDRMRRTTRFEYDELNRLRFKRYPDARIKVEYQYDKLNLRHVIASDITETLNYDLNYDKLNRLTNAVYPGSKVVAYEYYNNSLRKKLAYPDSTYITYHYDNLKRLQDIKDSSGNVIAHYDYDGLSSRRHGLTYANGASVEYAYDVLNRIKYMKNKASSGDTFTQFDYTYDKVGNRKTMTTTEGLYGYAYDKTYQLKDITYPDSRIAHYQYDNMGNRQYVDERGEHWDYTLKTNGLNQYGTLQKTKHNIDVEGTVKGNNPTVTVNSVDGTISGEGFLAEDITLNTGTNTILASATDSSGTLSDPITINLDTSNAKIFTYDGNGSITGISWHGEQTTYGYDYENRLVHIVIASPTESGEAIYKYDYLGRRIEKNIGGTITKYVYDGDNIIAEYDGNGILIKKFIFGPNIDEPIKGLSPTGTVPEWYYHFDALGSVTDLSNSSGQHIEHYVYSPFGKTKIYDATGMKLTDSAYGNYYRFTARQWDPESGLYYYRARYYDANLGRFLQADPIGYDGGSLNLYGYCSNNPTNRTDPMGLCDNPGIEKLISLLLRAIKQFDSERAYEYAEKIGLITGDYDIKASLQAKDQIYWPKGVEQWQFLNYGNYCGPGNNDPAYIKEAIDELDMRGMGHDQYYDRGEGRLGDWIFSDQIRRLPADPGRWVPPATDTSKAFSYRTRAQVYFNFRRAWLHWTGY